MYVDLEASIAVRTRQPQLGQVLTESRAPYSDAIKLAPLRPPLVSFLMLITHWYRHGYCFANSALRSVALRDWRFRQIRGEQWRSCGRRNGSLPNLPLIKG